MKHTKLFVLLAVAVMAMSACTAHAEGLRIGLLTPAKLIAGINESTQHAGDLIVWEINSLAHSTGAIMPKFYSNFTSMIMALNAGEIDELAVSQPVGEYITAVNPKFAVSCAHRITGASFVFGFRAGEDRSESLRKAFNSALASMRQDGTLDALRLKYCGKPGHDKLDPVNMERFPDAETVSIAVTGDVPPLDFVAPDGEAAGFNTAILSEIGKRLKTNIKLVYVETAARTTALMSGRADCIFWYQIYKDTDDQPDAPESVIFSDPYYDCNLFLHIKAK